MNWCCKAIISQSRYENESTEKHFKKDYLLFERTISPYPLKVSYLKHHLKSQDIGIAY